MLSLKRRKSYTLNYYSLPTYLVAVDTVLTAAFIIATNSCNSSCNSCKAIVTSTVLVAAAVLIIVTVTASVAVSVTITVTVTVRLRQLQPNWPNHPNRP